MDEPRRLYRSESERMLVGVCGGLGDYLRVDPVIVRVVFVLLTLAGGSGILVYLVLAIVVPSERHVGDTSRDPVRDNVEDLSVRTRELADGARSWLSSEGDDEGDDEDGAQPYRSAANTGGDAQAAVGQGPAAAGDQRSPATSSAPRGAGVGRSRAIVGWALVAIGAWLLLLELGLRLPAWLASIAWPAALIAIGVLLLVRRRD